jgi:hypothetical protein
MGHMHLNAVCACPTAALFGSFTQVLMALANSIKSKDLGALEAALDKATELGLAAHPEVKTLGWPL